MVVFGGLPKRVFEFLLFSGELVDAFGQIFGAEGVELLSELMPESLPHPLLFLP
ncbi:hypothetical protein [Streptomyces agglomeratus]|uniref:hypothetical protein n=1 Tax=Streptomyces agglomeratus TaxID=285458 RepID=UPI00159F2A71|nr:hypothetical protein [Streptomyces agglomeratus]